MATLIPAIGNCASRMTGGEKRFANTPQILQTAHLIAVNLLIADNKDDDDVPLLKPISCGRDEHAPILIKLPGLRDEAFAIADQLRHADHEAHA